jgi:acyl-CoA synthetase (AMP-forming)/AMP-acid ligase II
MRESLPCLPFPSPPYFILYLNSLLLATFYTLSFIDYIHVYPRCHPLYFVYVDCDIYMYIYTGVVGRIRTRGAHVMKGYLHETPPRAPGEWLYTGDWGFVVSKVTNLLLALYTYMYVYTYINIIYIYECIYQK